MKQITPPKLMPLFHSSTARGTLPIGQTIHTHPRKPAVLRDHQGAHHQGRDPPGHGAREGEWRQTVALLGNRHSIRLGNQALHRVLECVGLADESIATVYRYIRETVEVLSALAPSLEQAITTAAAEAFVLLYGALLPIDRIAADHPFSAGKHDKHSMNLQVIAAPFGRLLWASSALPRAVHDVPAAVAQADIRCWADRAYQGAGGTVRVPYRGHWDKLSEGQRAANACHDAAPPERVTSPSPPHLQALRHCHRRHPLVSADTPDFSVLPRRLPGVRQATVTVRGGWPEGAPERRMVLLPCSSVGRWSVGRLGRVAPRVLEPTDALRLDRCGGATS